ncbi:MAG: DUF2892 domain-containing protein [Caldilineaceae bacterium]|nr:DUF2892 domain-containing protein [Caldilineaceae bacterium]
MPFITFMTSYRGCIMRVVAGIALMSIGLVVVKGTLGTILALVALVPIAGGVLDFCLAGVLMGYPFRGAKAREQLTQEHHKP